MSLDFAVLSQDGAPEKTVSLGVKEHHELIIAAAANGLSRFHDFADYYEDVEIAPDDLPSLNDQARALRSHIDSVTLQCFLDDLSKLIAYATASGKALHTIAD